MSKYVIGVDGGGTKTHCALFDIEGNKIEIMGWGPTNHEVLSGGVTELRNEIDKMIQCILNNNSITRKDVVQYVFGMAGIDTKNQHKAFTQMAKDLGYKNVLVCNDAFLGVKAGCTSGSGVCAINGTGCTVVGIDSKGSTIQIGGQGNLTGDVGGGGYLGLKVVSTVYNALFKDTGPTLMSDMLFDILGITNKYNYMEVLTEQASRGTIIIKDLGKIVFEAANKGDSKALDILQHMGSENARSINGVINELDFQDQQCIEVVLAGSIYVKGKNDTAVQTLKDKVQENNPTKEILFKVLTEPPVMGAIAWALKLKN